MPTIRNALSKIRSLSMDAAPFNELPPERRVDTWYLNSDIYNRLFAERRAGVKMVDLGCGPLASPSRAAGRDEVGADNYIGIDLDIHNQPNLVADIAWLPFASNSLDLIRAVSVFEHTYNYEDILKDAYRALRPGGSLFIETPFFLEFHGYPSDYFRFTHVSWPRILEDIGFRVVACDAESGRGFFFNLAKVLELGSIAFTGRRWPLLRFILRGSSRLAWRLRPLDKHYRGWLYAAVVVIAEKPLDMSGCDTGTEAVVLSRSAPLVFSAEDKTVWQRHNTGRDFHQTVNDLRQARRRPLAQAVTNVKHLVKRVTRRTYSLKVENTTYHLLDELIGGHVYGQVFESTASGLCGVSVLFATFGRTNTPDVIFRLKESSGSTADIITLRISANILKPNHFHVFAFDPLPNSAGRRYCFSLESPDAVRGDSVGLCVQPNVPERDTLYRNGRPIRGQLAYTVQYAD
jgi:SAM-dependent methyltransferase